MRMRHVAIVGAVLLAFLSGAPALAQSSTVVQASTTVDNLTGDAIYQTGADRPDKATAMKLIAPSVARLYALIVVAALLPGIAAIGGGFFLADDGTMILKTPYIGENARPFSKLDSVAKASGSERLSWLWMPTNIP